MLYACRPRTRSPCCKTNWASCAAPLPGLPFRGGAIGWFAYDLGRRIERLPVLARDAEQVPDMAVGIYDWALVVDHTREQAWLVGAGRDLPARGSSGTSWCPCFGTRSPVPPAAPSTSWIRLAPT